MVVGENGASTDIVVRLVIQARRPGQDNVTILQQLTVGSIVQDRVARRQHVKPMPVQVTKLKILSCAKSIMLKKTNRKVINNFIKKT